MDSILPLFRCTLILAFMIPIVILAHLTSFFIKSECIRPTLYQRIIVTVAKTFQYYLPLKLLRKFGTFGKISHEQRKHWVKKLDANNDQDGWEGYLIADCIEYSEIGRDVDMVILYAHGGGFVFGNALGYLDTFIDWIKAWKLSYGAKTQILSLEYKLSPEYPFPAARDNMLACYQWLVTEKKISPSKIAFAGDSSGGNLAIVSAINIVNQLYVDPPAALILLSPFVSGLTNTQSVINNASYDCTDLTYLNRCLDAYIGDSNLLPSCPMISPLFENQLSGLPKVWACVGSFDIYLDDIRSFIEKLLQNNVKAELVIEDANIHGYAVVKALSRNGAYENSIKRIGKFLYGEKN
ncbi:alpha/beta hydrolase fold-domain-containing protein [Glomus cerebriforme]|uniref:Alpha/beta hydrolase fold-domain-containing protein n=1 Tax=Glomus cerebriforme TaxID=658196 RepID=A0A397SEJ0_9GLOM|nr:alpha/beta hydrolase fold-domain-containing protein [Glomus cerebriforme]